LVRGVAESQLLFLLLLSSDLADSVAVELKRELHIGVAKQNSHSLTLSS
jgi:hypothetical protein